MIFVFKVDGLIDEEKYKHLKDEIETNLKKGYILLTNGLELVDKVEIPIQVDMEGSII